MKIIIITWLIAGSLDLGSAVMLFVLGTKQNPSILMKAIASAALGLGHLPAALGWRLWDWASITLSPYAGRYCILFYSPNYFRVRQ